MSTIKWLKLLINSNKNSDLRHQLVQGAMGVGGLKLISLALALAASILLARGLGPEGYGQYVFVMAIISMLSLPVGPGVGKLIVREVARYHHEEEWGFFRGLLRRAHQWVLVGSLFMVLIISGFAAYLASWSLDDRWTLLLIGSLLLPLLGLNVLRYSMLQGLRKVIYAQFPDLLARPGLHLLIAGALLLLGMLNTVTALASQIAATAGAFLVGTWYLRRFSPRLVSSALPMYRDGEWGRALLPFTLLAAVSTLNGQIGILVLGWLGTDADVAVLQIAQNGSMLVVLSLTIINSVIGPHITHVHRDKDRARLQRLYRQSARGALIIALPIALPLIFFGEPIIHLVFGEAYADSAVWSLAILATGQLVNVAFGSVGLFLIMSGYEGDSLMGQVVGLTVNAVVAFLLIPRYGVDGAALSSAIGIVTWNVFLAFRFSQRLGFKPSVF